jgi:hypothetical protein
MGANMNFRKFLSFLGAVKSNLANTTAPPFFLAPSSIIEVPSCWVERPSFFVAASNEPSDEKRALCVLKWILASLRSQYYVGRDIHSGIKKSPNAFLGELFLAQWNDNVAKVKLIAEQVKYTKLGIGTIYRC